MRPKFQLYSYRVDDKKETPREKFLLVSLDGSGVHPGTMDFDRDDKRGYYTESVLVTMSFLDAPDLIIRQDQPESTEEGGSISNSLSLSFGAGFFGNTPTGNAGMGISNTITQTLPDFEFANDTRDATVRHTARLRNVGGNVYRKPPDLVNPSSMLSVLCDPPARATTNLPLISQALFHAPNGRSSPASLRIEVVHRMMCVEKTVRPADALPLFRAKDVPYDESRPDQPQHVHTPGLTVDTDPLIVPYSWDFTIPFGEVL